MSEHKHFYRKLSVGDKQNKCVHCSSPESSSSKAKALKKSIGDSHKRKGGTIGTVKNMD